jgi:hypothetical protein
MQSNFLKYKVQKVKEHTRTSWYALVRTCTDIIHKHTSFASRFISFPTPTSLHSAIDLFLVLCVLLQGSLLHCQTTQAWLATSELPQPLVDLIHIASTVTLTPAIWSSCVNACPAKEVAATWRHHSVNNKIQFSHIIVKYIVVHMRTYGYKPIFTCKDIFLLGMYSYSTCTHWYILVHTCTYLILTATVHAQTRTYQYCNTPYQGKS